MIEEKTGARVATAAIRGCEAVDAEVRVRPDRTGQRLAIDGMSEAAAAETRSRVEAALERAGARGAGDRMRATVEPGGSMGRHDVWDLPIAIGVLVAAGRIRRVDGTLIVGALGKNGDTERVRGAVAIALLAKRQRQPLMLPPMNVGECALAEHHAAAPVANIVDAAAWLDGERETVAAPLPQPAGDTLDMAEVDGNAAAKRALTIAAGGGHDILLLGPHGAGSTRLARRTPGLLPPMTAAERLETAAIHSVAGMLEVRTGAWRAGRVLRAPHWSASARAIRGTAGKAGRRSTPGEVSLAHNGVLLLDEIDRFESDALHAVREAARNRTTEGYPSRYLTIGTLLGDTGPEADGEPQDSAETIARHGLADWFDLALRIEPRSRTRETWPTTAVSTAELREAVIRARKQRASRGADDGARPEDELAGDSTAERLLDRIRSDNGEPEAGRTRSIAATIRDLDDNAANRRLTGDDVEEARALRSRLVRPRG